MSHYIRLSTNYYTHRKTVRLKAKLGECAYWLMPRLWSYAAEHQPDGDFSDYSAEEIAEFIGYQGDAQAMLQAMLDACFFDATSMHLHSWEDHNGYHASFSARAKKAAEARWAKQPSPTPPSKTGQDKKGIERKGKETSIASRMLVASRKPFKAPSIEDCQDIAIKTGLGADDGEEFFDHWEQKDWLVRPRQKLANVDAAMRTWKRNKEKFANNNGRPAKRTQWHVQKDIDAINEELIKNPWHEDAKDKRNRTPETKARYDAMLQRLKELKAEAATLAMQKT